MPRQTNRKENQRHFFNDGSKFLTKYLHAFDTSYAHTGKSTLSKREKYGTSQNMQISFWGGKTKNS